MIKFLILGLGLMTIAVSGAGADEYRRFPVPNPNNMPYVLFISSTPTVIIGSMTWTMEEFVGSGRWCAIYGHRWTDETNQFQGTNFAVMWYGCDGRPLQTGQKCSLCGKCRQKVKKQKEVLEWED